MFLCAGKKKLTPGRMAFAWGFFFAQGPDEVHIQQIGKVEAKRAQGELSLRNKRIKEREVTFNVEGGSRAKL